MNQLEQKDAELQAKRKELAVIFADYPNLDMSADVAADIKARNLELNDLGEKVEQLKSLATLADANSKALADGDRPVTRRFGRESEDPRNAAPQTLGAALEATAAVKSFTRNSRIQAGADLPGAGFTVGAKATFTTTGSTLTEYDRQPGIIMVGVQSLTIADLLARGTTTMNTIRYIQEDTYTNAATTVAEGATKPEATFDLSEQDAPVRKIAVTAKITDELFADFPAMRSYVDSRMPFMVRQQEETQLLNGDGNSPNLLGLLNTVGILTQATGAGPVPDAIYKGMVKIMSQGFFQPDGVVMHPLDWQDVRLLTTTTGQYLWGDPSQPGPMRIWGLPVVSTVAMTQNTALVGAFQLGAQIFYRDGIRIESTNSNEDDFKKNLIAIRVEERLALAVYRPKAFCTVTGV